MIFQYIAMRNTMMQTVGKTDFPLNESCILKIMWNKGSKTNGILRQDLVGNQIGHQLDFLHQHEIQIDGWDHTQR